MTTLSCTTALTLGFKLIVGKGLERAECRAGTLDGKISGAALAFEACFQIFLGAFGF